MLTIQEKIKSLTDAAMVLGRAGLIITEGGGENSAWKPEGASKPLSGQGFTECHDYLEIMDALDSGQKKIFYVERGDRLDSSVFEIAAEFEAGVIGLADRGGESGLKTAKWNPSDTSFVIVMTRGQAENSHPRLFEIITLIQSL